MKSCLLFSNFNADCIQLKNAGPFYFLLEITIIRLRQKIYFLSFTFGIAAILIFASSCQNQKLVKETETALPSHIITSAENYVKSITGEKYFTEFISVDLTNSKKIKSFYEVYFTLNDSKKEFVNEPIRFYVTEKGVIDNTKEISGIPNCKKTPSEGIFNLDEKGAIDAAASYGLEEGIKDWKVSFEWTNEFNKYTWHLLATYNESGGENNYKANGEELFINPFDGSLIDKRKWNIR